MNERRLSLPAECEGFVLFKACSFSSSCWDEPNVKTGASGKRDPVADRLERLDSAVAWRRDPTRMIGILTGCFRVSPQ
jgi:hypothetical protein